MPASLPLGYSGVYKTICHPTIPHCSWTKNIKYFYDFKNVLWNQ